MNMKNLFIAAFLTLGLVACGKVPAGNVGVKINLYGSDRGVQQEVLGPGWYWVGVYQELYTFPTYTQNEVWLKDDTEASPGDESLDFGTREGMNVNADIGISYHVQRDKVPDLFQKYRQGIDEITHKYVRNMVRDELVRVVSQKTVEEVYGSGKSAIMDEVQKVVSANLEPVGIVIEKIYWIGKIRLPENVVEALNSKIAATQKAQQRENEVAQARAEAQIAVAKAEGDAQSLKLRALAQAEANRILAASVTPELVQYQAVQRWNGILPVTSLGGSATPFIGVK